MQTTVAGMTHADCYPCAGCGKFAFEAAGVFCYWCRKEPARNGASPDPEMLLSVPSVTPAGKSARSIEELRARVHALPHRCKGHLCIAQVPGDHLMCAWHWDVVPAWLRIQLDKAHDPRAAQPWPEALVAQAIRATVPHDERSAQAGGV